MPSVSDLERTNLLSTAPGASATDTLADLRLKKYRSGATGLLSVSDFEKPYIQGQISNELLSDTLDDLRRKSYLNTLSLSETQLTNADLHYIVENGVATPVPPPSIIGTPTLNSNNTVAQVTITAPTGVQDGDYILVILNAQTTGVGSTAAVFGWKFLYTCNPTECGSATRWTQVYGRIYSSLDPGPWVIPISATHATQRKLAVTFAIRDCVPPDIIGGLIAPTGVTTTWNIPSTSTDKLAILNWHGVCASPNKGTVVSSSDPVIASNFIPVGDGTQSADFQQVLSKLVPANTAPAPSLTTAGPAYAAQSAIGFSFDKLQPHGNTIRYSSVSDMLSRTTFYWAHRGGSENWLELSQAAYDNAVAWGAPVLELSLSRTSDGVWFGLHDQYLDRTSPTAPANSDPALMTWAAVNAYRSQTPYGVGPYLRLDAFIARYASSGCILVVDPKFQQTGSFYTELLDQVIAGWPADKIIAKSHANTPAWSTAARARGIPTWGYFYEANIASIDTYAANWDFLGYDITATPASWSTVMSKGKVVVAFIINTQADKNLAISYGAKGLQCADVLRVIPRGA